MKFLIDNQLPISLAVFLRSRGFDCKHVIEVGLDRASDNEIWDVASNQGWTVVSKDEDFLHLVKSKPKTASLVWVRIGNCRSVQLIAAFERVLKTLEAALLAGEDVIELR